MRVGNIAGVSIAFSKWFLLLLILFGFFGMGTKVLLVAIAVCWHEVGHVMVAKILGITVQEIRLLPFGGVAKIETFSNISAKKQMMIATAGPIMSVIMAVAVFFMARYCIGWKEELEFCYQVNRMLALFNLLPAFPLDGGRIMHAMLVLEWGEHRADSVSLWISRGIACILALYVIGEYMALSNLNITVVYIIGFILVSAKNELCFASMKFVYMLTYRKKCLLATGLLPVRQIVALWSTKVIDVLQVMDKECYHVILVLNKDFEVCGTITETKLWESVSRYESNDEIGKFI